MKFYRLNYFEFLKLLEAYFGTMKSFKMHQFEKRNQNHYNQALLDNQRS